MKSRVLGGSGAIGVSAFYMDIRDLQATVTAGSCSSRVVFNLPKSRSTGFEAEFEAAPNSHVDFAISGSYNNAELRSTLTSTDASGNVSVVSGTYQYTGSRYTPVGDQDLGTLDPLSFAPNTIGGPVTSSTFTYDPSRCEVVRRAAHEVKCLL